MGDSSLPETRPDVALSAALSLAELQARFATPVTLSPDDVARVAARIPILRRRYNEHLQRAKIQFVDPRLTLTSCRSLLLLGRATVGVSHLVYQALRSLDEAIRTTTRPTVASEVVEAALDWSDRQIELIAWQLRALDAADTQSAALRALFAQMEAHARLATAGWTRLTGDVISAATGWLDSALALPRPGLTVQAYLAEIGHAREAEAAGRGMETARIIARLVTRRGARGFDPELLTLAALSHDCGLMLLPSSATVVATTAPKTTKTTAKSAATQQLRDLHASTGAALMAGLSEFSTELPALVAQHHRRLNDPQLSPAFAPRTQSPASRLLAVVVRWLELLERAGTEPTEPSTTLDQNPFAEPARRLLREAERGDWDRRLVEELLAGVGVAIADQLPGETSGVAALRPTGNGGQLRVDPADDEWPRANLDSASFDSARFDLARRARETHHVRSAR